MPSDREDLLALLYPVTRVLRRVEDEAAAHDGLTMWQYAVLGVVIATPGLNQRQIAQALHYSANRIIADLDELERRGLVERVSGPDRRSNHIRVTRTGTTVHRRIQRRIHTGEDDLLAALSPTQRRTFAAALRHLREQVREG